ncbi:hypothetical protein B2G71_05860 [Novosphingobium sp. PC22D]|uniref:hypothetical protein n=1 Tax=Novosphingobium sp. PC22D TaxID=1962403 RepID=UPI000BFAF5A0|nr:hypothetical protein [Novosphingobium sp. PC22D]PEQ13833.1 hypothetical protein B2G71_05860 [Novosphingobium sp. PC22D]
MMRMTGPPDEGAASFYALPHASLAGRGAAGGRLVVYCIEGDLQIHGEDGGFEVRASAVERLRFGMTVSRTALHHVARIHLVGEKDPLCLRAANASCRAYGMTMRRFLRAVAETRGMSRIERGLSFGSALLLLAMVLAIAGSFTSVALLYWSREHGMAGAIAFAALMVAVVALCAWHVLANELPRPVKSLEEAERYLPRGR